MVKKSRTFTIKSSCINVSGGRYKSSSPASAAKKAANRLYKAAKTSQKYKSIKRLTFVIKETTSGSDKTEFNYKATRTLLKKPLVRVINGVQIVNKFKVIVEAIKTKDITKKSRVKCNKKEASFFGGNEMNSTPANDIDSAPLDSTPEGDGNDVDEVKLNDSPDSPHTSGGAKKRRYKKKK